MSYTNFEYSVSLRRHSISPLTVELTCIKVLPKKIRLFTDERNMLSLPDLTIDHSTSFIPLNEPTYSTSAQNVFDIVRSPNEATVFSRPSKTTNHTSLNYTRISETMSRFGVTINGCSTILREVDMAVKSSSSRGTGVVEIKIWNIRTEIYEINETAEKLLIESYCSNSPEIKSLRVFGYDSTREEKQCVICMEDYACGSIVTKLPCNHDFHGLCIYKWLQINTLCPLCRSPITKGVQSGFQFGFDSIFRSFGL